MTTSPALRLQLGLVVLLGLLAQAAGSAPPALAQPVSGSVRSACMNDYFSYCNGHTVGSAALRSCMRANGPKLSSRCLNALVAAGEVSGQTVAKKKALAGAN